MAIFVAIFLSVLMQEPYMIDLSKIGSTEAKIDMRDVVDYELNVGQVKRITKAKSIMRYKNEDIANAPQMLLKKDDLIYVLESSWGRLIKDMAIFEGNVTIDRSDGANFKSQKLTYDIKSNLLIGDSPFFLKEKDLHVRGDYFTYSFKDKFLTGQNIYASFNLEEI